MEPLSILWNVLTNENEKLTQYVSLSLTFIEIFVTMKLFTTLLDISYTKKQRNIYIIVMGLATILTNLLVQNTLNIFIALFVLPIIIKYTFKTSILKSILAEIIPMLFFIILEGIYLKICNITFDITPQQCKNILIYRIPFMLTIYLTVFLISKFIHTIKINLNIFENIHKTSKRLLLFNLFFILIAFAAQFYLFIFYNKNLPLHIILISLISLVTYSIVSIYSIFKTLSLETAKTDLEQSKLHNKTLELLYSNTSAFKHDFSNIITALGGYVYTKDMDGLETYYSNVLQDFCIDNNLSTLNPKVINNPAIYNILATKYYKADELKININLQVFINLNELKLNTYEFTRMLSIFLDNAIEASTKCEKKLINIDIRDNIIQKQQILIIENTFNDSNINFDKLFEKGYTTKTTDTKSHGIGLWQVSRIINKYDFLTLNTTNNGEMFKQELIIHYK